MSDEIEIHASYCRFTTCSTIFPGGEVHLKISQLPEQLTGTLTVAARLQSPASLVKLMLAAETVDRVHRRGFRRLVIPYFPYARQDRVTEREVAFSLKPVAKLINSLSYDEVVTYDPHSDVTPAIVERLRVVSQSSWAWSCRTGRSGPRCSRRSPS